MADIRSPGAWEKLKGKNLSFQKGEGRHELDPLEVHATRVEVVEEPEVEPTHPYDVIRQQWERKNEFHRKTEAYASFLQEGGQELVTIFGEEKVANALEELLKGPVDERTGLYMLVRTLEPDYTKRQAVYKQMDAVVDKQVAEYEKGLKEQKTKDARKAYQDQHGGDYAPSEGAGLSRKLRTYDYRMYDRGAFSVPGALINMGMTLLRGDQTKKKYAVQSLKGRFAADAFLQELAAKGKDIALVVGDRLSREVQIESNLEDKRAARLAELEEEVKEHVEAIEAPYRTELLALAQDEIELFDKNPGELMESADAKEIAIDMHDAFVATGQEITEDMEKALNAAFPELAAINKTRGKNKKAEALQKFRKENAERIQEVQGEFQDRIDALARDYSRLFGLKKPKTTTAHVAISEARMVIRERRDEIEEDMRAAVEAKVAKLSQEIEQLVKLDVFKDE